MGRVLQHCLRQAYLQIDLHEQDLITSVITGTWCGHRFQVLQLFQNPRNLVTITRHLCLNLQSQEESYLPAGQECNTGMTILPKNFPFPGASPHLSLNTNSNPKTLPEGKERIPKNPILLLCYRLSRLDLAAHREAI